MIEPINKYRDKIIFAFACFLFFISLVFLVHVKITTDKKNETIPKDPIEVNLPIIDWQKYSGLSKRHPNDIIEYR